MRYMSVCSGIEAATAAWHPLGWTPAVFSEIEAFPRAVLAHHYPHVPLHGDFTTIKGNEYGSIDLLVGGTPCQSFSVAGLRKGLDDPRGNLMLEYGALARRTGARWLVWENVPGVLSSNGGRDFAAFLGMLAELGYGFAFRVLDAQYYGVAQRRRRVFVVGYLGDWRRAAAVLFERDSLSGNPAPSRETGQGATYDVAPCLTSSGRGVERTGETRGQDPVIAVGYAPALSHCLNAGAMGRQDWETETMIAQCITGDITHTLTAEGFDASEDGTGRGQPIVTAHAIQAGALRTNPNSGPDGVGVQEQIAYTLEARAEVQCAQMGMAVRRLTPRECERLQGFPDDFTAVPYRGKMAADGPRYKALGNSMAVPVMRKIGERIAAVGAIKQKEAA